MSKQKVIVLSVTEQGLSITEAARRYGVSRRWVHVLIRRYQDGGSAALAPRSRRPHNNARHIPPPTADRIRTLRRELTTAGLDAGPVTIAWHLTREGITAPSTSTIRRILHAAGLITPAPRKRPKSSLHRFEAAQSNETWQSDFTHWQMADGTDTEILNFLDDHSRYLLACTAYRPVTGTAVSETFLKTANHYGLPASTLTDNGLVYTSRFAGGKGGRNSFENLLHALKITQKTDRRATPKPRERLSASIKP